MSRHHPVYRWARLLAPRFPELTGPQVTGLALWSYGLVLAGSCTLTAVLAVLTVATHTRWDSLRSRLKDWYRPRPRPARIAAIGTSRPASRGCSAGS